MCSHAMQLAAYIFCLKYYENYMQYIIANISTIGLLKRDTNMGRSAISNLTVLKKIWQQY